MKAIATIKDMMHREITLEGEKGNYTIKIKEPNKNLCFFTFKTKEKAMKEFRKYKALEIKH